MKILTSIALLVFPAYTLAGGVSGGGGDAHPTHPVTQAEVVATLESSRFFVALYFNGRQIEALPHKPDWSALERKLFSGTETVMDKIRAVPIHLEMDGPCLDENGQPVDGSATSSPKESICMSVARMKEKLSKENLRNQTLALLAHEYSHLVGTTEEEAEAVQTLAIDDFLAADDEKIDEQFTSICRAVDLLVYMDLKSWAEKMETYSWRKIRDLLYDANKDFPQLFMPESPARHFSLRDESLEGLTRASWARVNLAGAGACVNQGENASLCKVVVDSAFDGSSEVDYLTYVKNMDLYDPETFIDAPGLQFRKLTNKSRAREEVLDFVSFVETYGGYCSTMERLRPAK